VRYAIANAPYVCRNRRVYKRSVIHRNLKSCVTLTHPTCAVIVGCISEASYTKSETVHGAVAYAPYVCYVCRNRRVYKRSVIHQIRNGAWRYRLCTLRVLRVRNMSI